MPTLSFDTQALWNVLVAVLGGLAVGTERQWSGHAVGRRAHFAGIRTFTLLGLVSGLSGWLWVAGLHGPATIFLAGLGALVVVAYNAASRSDIDGTTEVAAFVVIAAGVLAGAGLRPLASGIIATTALLLVEKKRLHAWVGALDRVEVRAGARFAVMATVVLPLLPEGPFGPANAIRPRLVWALVLLFSAFSFIGYVARRLAGPSRGHVLAGALGGAVSSTSVTLGSAEFSRSHPNDGRALAAGAVSASVVLFARVLLGCALLAPALTRALWPSFIAPAIVGLLLPLREWRRSGQTRRADHDTNPLRFWSALQMAAMFQIVLVVVALVTRRFGGQGMYMTAAVLGLTDVDALTVSMARLTADGTAVAITARAVVIGILANTVLKAGVALVVGRGSFRLLVPAGLLAMGLTLLGGLYWLMP